MLDWAEVSALIIPLFAWYKYRRQPRILKPIAYYLIVALFVNLCGNLIADFKEPLQLPTSLQRNTFIYNAHSIIRFLFFSRFFYLLNIPKAKLYHLFSVTIFGLFVAVNFSTREAFNSDEHLSGDLLSLEAFLLLLLCLHYYFHLLLRDSAIDSRNKSFWVVTALACYVVINFFLFLNYVPLIHTDPKQAEKMWDVHNIAYIILCLLIAKSFKIGYANR